MAAKKEEIKKENEYLKKEVKRLSRLVAKKGAENIRYQKRTRDLIKDLKERADALEKQKQEAQRQNKDLERINRIMTGRELKMLQLKGKIKQLEKRANEAKEEAPRQF